MLDIELLKMMKYKVLYKQLFSIVHSTPMDDKTNKMIEGFGKYFELFPDQDRVNMQVFGPRFAKWYPEISRNKEVMAVYVGIMRNAHKDSPESIQAGITQELHEVRLATTMANIATQWDQGNVQNLYGKIHEEVSIYKLAVGVKDEGWIDTPMSILLAEMGEDNGLRWRLACMNARLRGLMGGDFIVAGARPDAGKTSLIADWVSYFAPQLPPDRGVLWLNNEGFGKRIKPRIYQAALGFTLMQMREANENNTLEHLYAEAVGAWDRIKVKDIHGYNTGQVELLFEKFHPGLVVFDMIDNVRGFGDAARNDLMLEKMYQWARETGVEYDHITIATSQISADGEGLQYPTMDMLKDSKTGKQGAADLQIMMGRVNDPSNPWMRYIGMPKNKLRKDGAPASQGDAVFFNASKSRFEELPEDVAATGGMEDL